MYRPRSGNKSTTALLLSVGIYLFFLLSSVAAWVTHVVVCLQDDRWGFLIAGAIAFPIAIIHGWLIWLGVV